MEVVYSNGETTVNIRVKGRSLFVIRDGVEVAENRLPDNACWIANEFMRYGNIVSPSDISDRNLANPFSE